MSKATGKGASKKGASAKKGSPFKSSGSRSILKTGRSQTTGPFPKNQKAKESTGLGRYFKRGVSKGAASKGVGTYPASIPAAKKASRSSAGGWLVQDMQNGKKVTYRVPSKQMELYIRYKELRPGDLALILQYIESFTEIAIDEYEYLSSKKIKGQTRLRIIYAQTGNSLTFRFDGGWLPKVIIRDGKIEIALSAKMGVAAFVFYAIITGVNSSLDTGTKYYDYQLKKLEYEEKAEAKAERQKKAKEKEEAGKQFMDTIRNNQLLTQVRVNNIYLKNGTSKK